MYSPFAGSCPVGHLICSFRLDASGCGVWVVAVVWGPLGGVSSGCEQFRGWLRVVEGVMPLGIGDGSCQDIGDTSVGPGGDTCGLKLMGVSSDKNRSVDPRVRLAIARWPDDAPRRA